MFRFDNASFAPIANEIASGGTSVSNGFTRIKVAPTTF